MTQLKNFLQKVWTKIEQWGEATARARVERYLGQSQNIVELEKRMREIDQCKTRYSHYI